MLAGVGWLCSTLYNHHYVTTAKVIFFTSVGVLLITEMLTNYSIHGSVSRSSFIARTAIVLCILFMAVVVWPHG